MSDPVTASIQIALQAVKTGAAVATWWQTRQQSRPRDSAGESTGGYYRQSTEDLLYVMATIGQWLFSLEVVNLAALPAARGAVRQAFTAGDPEDDDLGYTYDNMNELVQNAVASAMVFCAECWPMHIWKGFGCGVFNELRWADPNNSNIYCLELDNSITALKSQPHQWQLLKKSPSAISKADPETQARDKSAAKKLSSLLKDVVQSFEKEGFPQPVAPYEYIRISYWWIPFATWNGNSMYENEAHRYEAAAMYQMDPGRFLWAWTAGKQARLSPGEAALLLEEHIGALARWLEGLKGIPFRVLLDNQVNYGKIKFGRSTRNLLKKNYGNELGICGLPFVIVHDPKLEAPQALPEELGVQFNSLKVSSPVVQVQAVSPTEPPLYSEVPQYPVTAGISFPDRPVPKRRPVPLPPVAVVRSVTALHDFVAESAEELSFSVGEVLEILNDKSDDGWWKARLAGKTGLIPSSFVKDMGKVDTAQSPNQVPETPGTAYSPEPVSPSSSIQRKPLSTIGNSTGRSQSGGEASRSIQPTSSSPIKELRQPEDRDRIFHVTTTGTVVETETVRGHPLHEPWSSQMPPEQHQYQQAVAEELQQQVPTQGPEVEPGLWSLGASQGVKQPALTRTFYGHTKSVAAVTFSPSSNLLVSGSKDKTVRLWDTTSGSALQTLSGHDMQVEDLSFAPDGRLVASASADDTVRLWDVRTNAGIRTLNTSSWANSVAFSPDGAMLAVGLTSNKIQLWDGRSLSILHTLKGHKSIAQSVAFSPDGKVLASGSNDKTVRTWDPVSTRALHTIKAHPGMMNYVMTVAFSPDGQLLASGSLDGTVKLWNPSSGVLVRTLKCGTGVNSVAFSPDGKTIATASILQKLILWNLDGVEVHNIKAHEKGVESVAFSSDGRLLATSSEDKTVKLWKLA